MTCSWCFGFVFWTLTLTGSSQSQRWFPSELTFITTRTCRWSYDGFEILSNWDSMNPRYHSLSLSGIRVVSNLSMKASQTSIDRSNFFLVLLCSGHLPSTSLSFLSFPIWASKSSIRIFACNMYITFVVIFRLMDAYLLFLSLVTDKIEIHFYKIGW